jgi:hypothetical protein
LFGKNWIFRGKSFEKSFFKQIPRYFRGKWFSAEKMYEKSAPDELVKKSPENSTKPVFCK